jgi:radical SAM superfamily enzyme YgiQ (UPF0313 family)
MFKIRPFEDVRRDVEDVASHVGRSVRRIFLCDGDALIMPQAKLLPVLDLLNDAFPRVERIGVYGNAKSILRKSPEEMKALSERKLGIVYLGMESGDDEVLKAVNKGTDRIRLIQAAKLVKNAGITLSVTVLLGIGGQEGSRRHALETGSLLTEMDPDFVGALSLMVIPGTTLHEQVQAGEFNVPDTFTMIEELGVMIANTDLTNCLFTSNHASNYLPLRVRLPEQKEEALAVIGEVLERRDSRTLRPEYLRAL